MPIHNQVGMTEEADEGGNRKCRNRRWILSKEPFGRFGLVCETSPQTENLEYDFQRREEEEEELVASL